MSHQVKRANDLATLAQIWYELFGKDGAAVSTALLRAKMHPRLDAALKELVKGAPGQALGQIMRNLERSAEPVGGFYIASQGEDTKYAKRIWRAVPVAAHVSAPDVRRVLEPAQAARTPAQPKSMNIQNVGGMPMALPQQQQQQQPQVDSALPTELPINLNDLRNASMQDDRDLNSFYLGLESGQIFKTCPAEPSAAVPKVPKQLRYEWIKTFVETAPMEDEVRAAYQRAIQGEGAFRRFKVTNVEHRMSDAYHAFRDAKHDTFLQEWLSGLGVKVKLVTQAKRAPGPVTSANLQKVLFLALNRGVLNAVQAHELVEIAEELRGEKRAADLGLGGLG
jgi:hypothetical protein